MKIVIYKNARLWDHSQYRLNAGEVISETDKNYKIKPIKSGHFNGYVSRLPKEYVVFSFDNNDEAEVYKYINILKKASELQEEYNKADEALRAKYDGLFNQLTQKEQKNK